MARDKSNQKVLKRPSSTTTPTSNAAGGLQPFPEKGKPAPRVRDMKSLFGVYQRAVKDDEKSAYNRSLVRDAADGAPPWDDADLEQEGRFNLNFHDLSGLLDERNATYTDLIDSPNELARFYFPETADEAASNEFEEKAGIIGEEYTQLNRNDWPDFYPSFDVLVNEMAQHGVSMGYFPDEETWKWKSAGLDDFLLPRQCRASEDAVDVLFIRERIPAHRFYGFIKEEKFAAGAGWNIPAARQALVKATTGSLQKSKTWGQFWAQTVDELANNDVGSSYAKSSEVECVHALIREYNSKFSHYIFPEDGGGDGFFFERRDRYEGHEDLFTIFTARVGRNGKYHSVRGDLWRAYPGAQAKNRLLCSALDSTAHSMAILLQPNDPEAQEDFALVLNGPVGWLPSEANVVEQRATPNLSQNALPMIQELTSVTRRNLGLPGPQGEIQQANTKYGQMYEQLMSGSLTGAQVTRFYRSWRRLLVAQFRRIQKIGPDNDKYPEIQEFYARLLARGVTPEEVQAIERVEPYRAAGAGSVGARLRAYDGGMEALSLLDEVGRARYLRDWYGEKFGRDLAAQYVGRPQKPRFVIDARMAELENSTIKLDESAQIVPSPGENDLVHGQVHLARAAQEVQAVEEYLTQKGDIDPTPVFPALGFVQRLLEHAAPHVDSIADDPTRQRPYVELRKALQQISAKWESMAELATRLKPSEKAQQEQMTKLQMKLAEHRLNMQIRAEEHQAKIQMKAQDTMQRMNLRRVQTDMKLATQIAAS